MKLNNGWRVMTLDTICAGDLQTGPFGSQLHADEYVAEGIPVVMPRDIVGGQIIADTTSRIPLARSEQLRRYRLREGDVVFSRRGDVARAALVSSADDGYESTLDLPAFDISPAVNPDWLLGYLTRPTYYTRQLGLARGQRKARRVHPSDLFASSLRVPHRDLQDRIAEILISSKCDIDKSKHLLESLKTQKRGLMQKLLTGQWRLAVQDEATTA